MKKTVYLTSDHAGYDTKIEIAKILENEGYKVVIEGATNAETKTSYAEIGIQFAKQYIADKEKISIYMSHYVVQVLELALH